MTVPNPGSPAALDAGCTCAVLDNCHGRFPPIPPDNWYITMGCPLHAPAPDLRVIIPPAGRHDG